MTISIPQQLENMKDQPMKEIISLLIEIASSSLTESDYPDLIKEFNYYYSSQLAKESFPAIIRIPAKNGDQGIYSASSRVVIIGDIHSDFNALSSILRKLSASSFDYFSKAIFIFCGDYTDRGRRPFETLRLLYALKSLIGDRCIFLKGNHELIRYSCLLLSPAFYPADTCELMNRVLSPEINNLYASYLARLPYMVSLHYSGKKYLICHGSIPRYDNAPYFDEEKLLEYLLPSNEYSREGILLNQMLWGDPGNSSSSFKGLEVRFEFSKSEFLKFMDRNGFDILIRGHQPVDKGVMLCYNNRLISLFSSGGHNNPDSCYPDDVSSPAFLILMENGEIRPEKVFGHEKKSGRMGELVKG
jgi:hypothetical protein